MATPREALAAAENRWNAGDLEGYLRLYDDSVRLQGYRPQPLDIAGVTGAYEGIFAAFEGPKLEFHEVVAEGDAAAVRFTMTGRHIGDFLGVPATGRDVALGGIAILHFRSDKVVEAFFQSDMLGVLVQLGAVPAPA